MEDKLKKKQDHMENKNKDLQENLDDVNDKNKKQEEIKKKDEDLEKKLDELNDENKKQNEFIKIFNESDDEKENVNSNIISDQHLKKQVEALKRYANDMDKISKKKQADMEKKNNDLQDKL